MKSSGSRISMLLALVPGGYQFVTRIRSTRDLAYLVASSWVPEVWLIFRFGHFSPVGSVACLAVSYLAFVAIYEIGYFVNDVWDAHRGPRGRDRIQFSWSAVFATFFVAIRIGSWLALSYLVDSIASPLWLSAFAVLLVSLAEHNFLRINALRSATFWQLATLRFVVPVLPWVPRQALPVVIASSFLFYVYYRWLSYLDSKNLLLMPERRTGKFQLLQLLLFLPLTSFVAYALQSWVIIELACYFVVVFGAWALISRKAIHQP